MTLAVHRPGFGILDAVAVTRADTGTLVMLDAAEAVPGGVLVAAPTAAVLELLDGAPERERVERAAGPAERVRWTGVPRQQLRAIGTRLTPASSALVAVVAPLGAAELAGILMEEATKLAVEDLPASAVRDLADRPALLFVGGEPVAAPSGRARTPHPAFAAFGSAQGGTGPAAGRRDSTEGSGGIDADLGPAGAR